MEFHTSLGLPFLHQLLEANIPDQTRMARRTAETTDFLSHAQYAYLGVYHRASPFWEMTWRWSPTEAKDSYGRTSMTSGTSMPKKIMKFSVNADMCEWFWLISQGVICEFESRQDKARGERNPCLLSIENDSICAKILFFGEYLHSKVESLTLLSDQLLWSQIGNVYASLTHVPSYFWARGSTCIVWLLFISNERI